MAKQNPWALARPAFAPETATFSDPHHPGVEFTLTCRPLDAVSLMLAFEAADKLCEKWITGKGNAPALTYPLGGGQVRLSETLLRVAALVDAQQLQPNGEPFTPEEYYNVDDLIGIAYNAPVAWSQLAPWAQSKLNLDADAGNLPGAEEDSSSAPSSTTGTNTRT